MNEITTQAPERSRARIQSYGLALAKIDAILAARKIIALRLDEDPSEIIGLATEISEAAFRKGVEAQSDALQPEFTAYEERIAALEQRIAHMEQLRNRINASAFPS